MNALIALAVWCQPHGPVTILTTQHRRPTSSSSSSSSSLPCPTDGSPSGKGNAINKTITKSSSSSSNSSNASNTTDCLATSPQSQSQRETSAQNGPTSPFPDGLASAEHSNASNSSSISTSTSNSLLDTPAAVTSTTNTPSLEQKKSRRSLHQPSPAGSTQSPVGSRPSSTHPGLSPSTNNSPCECQFSIPSGEKSLHSVDPANSQLAYISQPAPVDTNLFAPIRIACIRSLNSETYCGREGSVFFGDGVNGYVLSYMFTVYDAQSRGHRVKYTIMTMMTDRVYLVASMEYLISQFQVIASNLQSMANALCPQQPSPAPRSLSYSSSSHRGSIMPENAPTKRGRPLTDVLAKPDIFVQLHAAFVSVLSNCSRRLTERHIQGRPVNEYTIQESNQEHISNNGKDQSVETIDSLRELRRVLGRQSFDRLIWNSLIGNQVIVRGEESGIVREIIKSLENILPKDCCDIIMDSPVYEPSYACNILGLDRSVPIPSDMDPQDFILLDICMNAFDHQISTPSISHPADNNRKDGSENVSSIYQADWSSTTLVADMTNLSTQVEKSSLTEQTPASDTVDQPRTPTSSPDVLYSPREGFQAQKRRYLLQAGEEPPEALATGNGMINGKDTLGRKAVLLQNQQYPLYIETVNGILDLKMPRSIEIKRLVVLREEWISKSKQFHNLYKAGYASDESVLARYLQSMQVDKRDLKILRFFTRCARSSSFQHQKYHSEDPMAAAAVEIKRDASD